MITQEQIEQVVKTIVEEYKPIRIILNNRMLMGAQQETVIWIC